MKEFRVLPIKLPYLRISTIGTRIHWQICRTYSSSQSASLTTSSIMDMKKRQIPTISEHLSSTSAQKLAKTLSPFLPEADASELVEQLKSATPTLPPSFHLVYFNPAHPEKILLEDGTDPIQSPGMPYERRMWAGGNLTFGSKNIQLDGSIHSCVESISKVEIKGNAPNDKVFVTIERKIGKNPSAEAEVVEKRTIVFMRRRTQEEVNEAKQKLAASPPKASRLQSSHTNPSFSFKLNPSRTLLFRYSALTFNAHSIHLDSTYCRDVEFHRDLLFHGPLSLTFLITLLQSHIDKQFNGKARIADFHYRNIAPLYVEEELIVCGKESANRNEYHLWIENAQGMQCVRATGTIVKE